MASGFSGMRLRRVTTPTQAVGGGGDHDRWYGVSAHRPRSVAPNWHAVRDSSRETALYRPICARAANLQIPEKLRSRGHHDWPVKRRSQKACGRSVAEAAILGRRSEWGDPCCVD